MAPVLSPVLEQCLEDLESRLDESREEANRQAWVDFLEGRTPGDIFTPPPRRANPAGVAWPGVHINDALADPEAMVLRELAACSAMLDGGAMRLNVRCNYGSGILPTLFGCELFIMERAMDTLPAARPLGSAEAVRRVVAAGVPDLDAGLGRRVFQTAQLVLEVFRRYTKIGRHVVLYHPDIQGPIDVAEVVWGSDIFYAFYEERSLLRDFLAVITETYAAFMRRWYELVPPPPDGYATHWGLLHKGRLMLRNDSLMNLSPAAYVEFVRPHDQRLFDEFGGGAMHFCGRGDHYIGEMVTMRGLTAIQLSQPRLNDMDTIYRHTVDRGLVLLNFSREAALRAGRPLRGLVQC